LIVKNNARYFVRDRETASRGLRDSVDACQRPPLNASLSASLQDELLEFLETIALDHHMHS
jgi:hypothetical protein